MTNRNDLQATNLFGSGGAGGDFHLADALNLLRRRWKLIAVLAVAGVGTGLFHYFNTPETYQASTRIQIERRSANPLGTQAFWLESWWSPEFYATQNEILKSRGLAERVVKHLRLWEDPAFESAVDESSIVGEDGEVTAALDDVAAGRLAGRVRGGMSVSEVRGTQLVDITYRSADPRVAMKLANGYAEAFIQLGKEERRSAAQTASDRIDAEIESLELDIRDKESRLLDYSREENIVATDDTSNVTLQRLESANNAYLEAQRRRIEAQSEYNELLNRPQETIAEQTSGGIVASQRSTVLSLRAEYESKLETFQPSYPAMAELRSKIDEAQAQLDELVEQEASGAVAGARTRYLQAQRTEQSLLREYESMKGETLRYQSASTEYKNLLAEVEAKREMLQRLQRSQSETSVAVSTSQEATIRQIDRALLPTAPVSPNLRRNVSLGMSLGLLAGIALVLLVEYLDRTLKTPDDVERRLALPVLTVVPDLAERSRRYGLSGGYGYGYGYGAKPAKRKRGVRPAKPPTVDLIPHHSPRLAISEAYRSLRTSLLLSSADELRAIIITSSSAGEGKTATASNLGAVMAQLGRRTLFVDCDLRKPRAHQVFSVSNRVGLVTYLVGQASFEEAIEPTGIEGLDVASSGPSPPNPSELLSSERMQTFIETARERYDFVVIDTPPALAVTDATVVSRMVDGVVLCLRAGKVSREDAKAGRDRIMQAGQKILGIVLNCYRSHQGGYHRSYSYHHQAYGSEHVEDEVA